MLLYFDKISTLRTLIRHVLTNLPPSCEFKMSLFSISFFFKKILHFGKYNCADGKKKCYWACQNDYWKKGDILEYLIWCVTLVWCFLCWYIYLSISLSAVPCSSIKHPSCCTLKCHHRPGELHEQGGLSCAQFVFSTSSLFVFNNSVFNRKKKRIILFQVFINC